MLGSSPRILIFHVAGTPAPQGSKRHVGNGRMVESSKKVAPWRQDVRAAAAAAMADNPDWNVLAPALCMRVTFRFARPRSHYGTGASTRDVVRATAPDFVATRPDLDKLVRSTCDALTSAGAYVDDSRVVELAASKVYANAVTPPGALITLEAYE